MTGKRQVGFTYIGLLIFVAAAGAGLAAYAETASHAAQREKEAELLFHGNAYQAAIASYYKKEQRWRTFVGERGVRESTHVFRLEIRP